MKAYLKALLFIPLVAMYQVFAACSMVLSTGMSLQQVLIHDTFGNLAIIVGVFMAVTTIVHLPSPPPTYDVYKDDCQISTGHTSYAAASKWLKEECIDYTSQFHHIFSIKEN